MYTEFFQFSRRPFELLPEPGFLYLTAQHSRAIANIEFALMNRDSFVVISGEVGIGKTTILNRITADLPENYKLARLTHTTLSPVELIQAILSAFGIPSYRTSRVYLLDKLRDFLVSLDKEDRHAVIMVDEAQNLRLDTIEELRLLSCIDGEERKLLSNVLVGQPALNELVDDERLANLRDRTRLRQHLAALSINDTADYIRHRLEVAGGRYEEIFEADVAKYIHQATGGIPRRINTICDTALAITYIEKQKRVTREIVTATLEELRFGRPDNSMDSGTSINKLLTIGQDRKDGAADSNEPQLQDVMYDASASDLPWIAVYHEDEFLQFVTLDKMPFLIGRDKTNTYAMPCGSVSRRHAVVICIDGEYLIEDLSSTNGTRLNDVDGRRHQLNPGDVVTLGLFKFVFCPQDVSSEFSQSEAQ